MRAQVASLVLLALFVSAQAGFISISKDGSGSFSNVLAAKAAGKGVIITKGTTEAASGRAAAQPALVTAVAAKSVDGKVDAAKSVDVKGDAAKADVKVETAAPQAKKEEVKAAAPAPAAKAEPKKEEPKAAAAPAPKKEEPKKAEAQATVVAAKPAEAPKQAAAAAVVEKKVDVQVTAPLVTKDVQVAPTKSVDISASAGKSGVQKSLIVNAGRKLQGGKGGSVSVVVGGDSNSGRAAAVAPSKVNGGASVSKSISKSFSLPTISISKAAATQTFSASKVLAASQATKSASINLVGKGRKLQGGKGGSVSVVVGGDSNSGRAAAPAPRQTAGKGFSASKVIAFPQITLPSFTKTFTVGKSGK